MKYRNDKYGNKISVLGYVGIAEWIQEKKQNGQIHH